MSTARTVLVAFIVLIVAHTVAYAASDLFLACRPLR
jgi:hypothetical protein